MNRTDMNGKSFDYSAIPLSNAEIAKVCSEINSCYSKYAGLPIILHRSMDLDYNWCIYYVENRGFNDYNIFEKFYD